MQLQAFLFKNVKVRGPQGVYEEERAFPTGSGDISHGENVYRAVDGWADVPLNVALELKGLRFVHPHGGTVRYCSPDEVDETLRLGLMEQGSVRPPAPQRRGPGRPPRQREYESED